MKPKLRPTLKITVMLLVMISVLFPYGTAYAEEDTETEEELKRQAEELDLSAWDGYFESSQLFSSLSIVSAGELVLNLSEEKGVSLVEAVLSIFKTELKNMGGAVAVLSAAALMTALAGLLPDDGVRRTASVILSLTAISLIAGAYASLLKTAKDAVKSMGEFTERSLPVMTTAMAALGSESSIAAMSPLMIFLSGTVVSVFERILLPTSLAAGVISIIDSVSENMRLSELVKLLRKAVKWTAGLITVLYSGAVSINSLTAASRDGLMIRTAKYTLDKLVPVVGSMVSGTVDSVMGCALMLRNGVGMAALILLLSVMLRPMLALISGIFVFRVTGALCQPTAEPRAVNLISCAADVTGDLLGCVMAVFSMLVLTVLVFTAAGGIAAGLW